VGDHLLDRLGSKAVALASRKDDVPAAVRMIVDYEVMK
jgi:hypothetical protein